LFVLYIVKFAVEACGRLHCERASLSWLHWKYLTDTRVLYWVLLLLCCVVLLNSCFVNFFVYIFQQVGNFATESSTLSLSLLKSKSRSDRVPHFRLRNKINFLLRHTHTRLCINTHTHPHTRIVNLDCVLHLPLPLNQSLFSSNILMCILRNASRKPVNKIYKYLLKKVKFCEFVMQI